MSPLQIVCAILAPLFWDGQYVVIKVGLTAFPPLFFVGLRFVAVAVMLLPFVGRPSRCELGPIMAISVFFGGFNFALFFTGLGQGTASVRPSRTSFQRLSPFCWPGPFSGSSPRCESSLGSTWHLPGSR